MAEKENNTQHEEKGEGRACNENTGRDAADTGEKPKKEVN